MAFSAILVKTNMITISPTRKRILNVLNSYSYEQRLPNKQRRENQKSYSTRIKSQKQMVSTISFQSTRSHSNHSFRSIYIRQRKEKVKFQDGSMKILLSIFFMFNVNATSELLILIFFKLLDLLCITIRFPSLCFCLLALMWPSFLL